MGEVEGPGDGPLALSKRQAASGSTGVSTSRNACAGAVETTQRERTTCDTHSARISSAPREGARCGECALCAGRLLLLSVPVCYPLALRRVERRDELPVAPLALQPTEHPL